MGTQNGHMFVDYLMRVGNDTEKTDEEGKICLLEDICVSFMGDVPGIEKLANHVFPALDHNMDNLDYTRHHELSHKKRKHQWNNMCMIGCS